MKFREIILDFTSLLDVIMIILFWFILNYHNQTVEIQSKAEQAVSEATSIASELQAQQQRDIEEMSKWREEATAQMSEWQEEISSKLEMIENIDEESASNLNALLNFQKGAGIEIVLTVVSNSEWDIRIKSGDNIIGTISADDGYDIMKESSAPGIASEMIKIFDSVELMANETIIGTFIYDGDSVYSYKSMPTVAKAIEELQKSYKRFYCLEINKSD